MHIKERTLITSKIFDMIVDLIYYNIFKEI